MDWENESGNRMTLTAAAMATPRIPLNLIAILVGDWAGFPCD
jgi:hypothetical protein